MELKTDEKKSTVNPRVYVWVWLALILMTGLTVSAAGRNLGRLSIAVALAIAAAKSGLVLNYFMHLSKEKETIFKVIIPLTLTVLILFIGIVYLDVVFRF
jgi:cytochrome c oxidase subunit IV